ncbi:uncharacterized protein LOC124203921 [Daphnia pulex]|uniref:uncharacterized protein LOC124203921 n=1 Tax=Daphnia pulex TaxID=6669 RepID=UPI001EDDF4D0|nr:uncharacterized protein LOC124203921 [Daphnia pulex]
MLETGKENVSVKTFASQNFLLDSTFSSYRLTSSAALHRSTSKDPSSVSKMGIWLSWKLILVASILFLTSLASSESPDPLTDPTSSDTREDKPLPNKISSVQLGSVCVNIYDSQTTSRNKKIYFYSPMALLNHLNVVSIHNQTVTQGILSASFSIWNQEVRNKVVQHLSQLLSQQIEPSQVKIFPFDSVRLTSKVQSADFSLTNEWRLYDNQQTLRFTLICPTREDCDQVKTQMRNSPEQFRHLQLDFNPKLNDDDCFNDEVGVAKENELPAQVKELLVNLEDKFKKELIAIREETKRDFVATSQMLAAKIKVTEENLAVVQNKLEITEKELETTKTSLTSTRIELSHTKSTVDDLTTKLKTNSQRLDNELKATEDNLRKELSATLNQLETTTTNLASTRTELRSTNAIVEDLTTKLNSRTNKIVDIGHMPTSCEDLERMGQKVSGFFSVKGARKMEMIYCDFHPNKNDLQKWIGYADVKSAPVHFYVTRNSSFYTEYTPIPFDLARVNEGNAMNLTSGIFTAPRPGIYFFSFAGTAYMSESSYNFYSRLFLNGNRIGRSLIRGRNSLSYKLSPLTLQCTLDLKKGDQLWVTIECSDSSYLYEDGHYGGLYYSPMGMGGGFDDGGHDTHFAGFMLEEEIVASF